MSSLVSEPVADTHVRLIIASDALWLDIPYTILSFLCLYPVKYFRYLGWAILGLQGKVYYGAEVARDDATVVSGETYELRTENMDGAAPVNVDVSKKKTESITQTSRRENLRRMVEPRDGRCIFTGAPPEFCDAIHIIPFARGQDWFESIVRSRRDTTQSDLEDKPLDDLELDSASNAFLAFKPLHGLIDSRWLAVLSVPNPVLTRDDIDTSIDPHRERDGRVKYPTDRSYILQWLKLPDDEYDRGQYLRVASNNSLAAFAKDTPIPKPSPLLLHYMYGCTAIRCWGREHGSMSNLPGFVRAPEAAKHTFGSPTKRSSQNALLKRRGLGDPGPFGSSAETTGSSMSEEEQDHEQWRTSDSGAIMRVDDEFDDEFDRIQDLVYMLTLRGRPELCKAIEAEKKDYDERLEAWREGVMTANGEGS